jgi:hypothetical protein
MVPDSVARNKGQRLPAEQVAAQREKAQRKGEDDWPRGRRSPRDSASPLKADVRCVADGRRLPTGISQALSLLWTEDEAEPN